MRTHRPRARRHDPCRYSDDLQAEHERMTARGAEFTMPPTDVTASKIAMLHDTCGNIIQITQLMRR
ncbi:MAG TPA: VOC family protein [Kofleriaceae bacterium]|nr:VOC family protein [Kofleriaceae bacterium]